MAMLTILLLSPFISFTAPAEGQVTKPYTQFWTPEDVKQVHIGNEVPRRGGTLARAVVGDPYFLAPMDVYYGSQNFFNRVFQTLIKLDMDFNPQPWLAESWEISPDFKTFTWHLRKGVKWNDGKPFTSEDVKFSVETMAEFHPTSSFRVYMPEMELPDENTIIWKLDKPWVTWPLSLHEKSGHSMIPKHIYGAPGVKILDRAKLLPAVGTGPWLVKEYVKASHGILEPNPLYWRTGVDGKPLPYLDRLVIRVVPDAQGRVALFDKKEVQYLDNQSLRGRSKDLDRYAKDPNTLMIGWGNEWGCADTWVSFNLREGASPLAPLEDPDARKARQALHFAVDRDELVTKAWGGYSLVTTGPHGSTCPHYNKDLDDLYPYDPDKAAKISMKRAGSSDRMGSGTRTGRSWHSRWV
jgi:peptide/nickel transport system substrate-binding protein